MDFKLIPLVALLYALITSGVFEPPRQVRPANDSPAVEVSAAQTASDTVITTDHQFRTTESRPPIKTAAVVTWLGSQDHRWSNPRNWEGSRVPGSSDVARFTERSNSAVFDAASPNTVAGLVLEPDYSGTVTLKRDMTVSNDLVLAGGTFNQGNYHLSLSNYRQTGGTCIGGDASLRIQYEATVSGGTLLTSKSMTAQSLTITTPGVVTMAANSKLNLTSDGEPLRGNGLLDVTTNGPNSLEYTGRATVDVTAAGPIQGALSRADPANLQMPPRLRDTRGVLGAETPARSQMPSWLRSATLPEPSQALPGSFSRSAALTLTANEEYPWAAAIDTVNGFAYFGTLARQTPGIVVKVRLSDFTRVGALVLNAGDDPLRCHDRHSGRLRLFWRFVR